MAQDTKETVVQVRWRASEAVRQRLQAAADRDGTRPVVIVRQAVADHLERKAEGPLQAAESGPTFEFGHRLPEPMYQALADEAFQRGGAEGNRRRSVSAVLREAVGEWLSRETG